VKKVKLLFFPLLLASATSWTAESNDRAMAHIGDHLIQCTIKPIDRARIHRNQEQFANMASVSDNWSGYVASTDFEGSSSDGTVTSVSGSWTIPAIPAPPNGESVSYCAIWVGIDGYGGSTVQQMGTLQEWIGGSLQSCMFFEMFPGPSWQITGFPANTGDVVNVSVTYTGNNVYQMIVNNVTQNASLSIPTDLTTAPNASARRCAEWIVETPAGITVGGGSTIFPLGDFNTVAFTDCSATINGTTGSISNGNWMNDELAMIGLSGDILAQPSPLSADGTSFEVMWESSQ